MGCRCPDRSTLGFLLPAAGALGAGGLGLAVRARFQDDAEICEGFHAAPSADSRFRVTKDLNPANVGSS